MSKQNTVNVIRQLIGDTVTELGYSLWDVEYVKEGAAWYLRITIDSPNGIGIGDCEAVYRGINPILDEKDPIEWAYTLEVMSPGVERVLKTNEHFVYAVGQVIVIKLFKAQEGQKEFVGLLLDVADNSITLQIEEQSMVIDKTLISKANVYYEF